jgi:hypothetical protein
MAHGLICCRQRKEERSTPPQSALNPDTIAVCFDDAPDCRPAKTCAASLTPARPPEIGRTRAGGFQWRCRLPHPLTRTPWRRASSAAWRPSKPGMASVRSSREAGSRRSRASSSDAAAMRASTGAYRRSHAGALHGMLPLPHREFPSGASRPSQADTAGAQISQPFTAGSSFTLVLLKISLFVVRAPATDEVSTNGSGMTLVSTPTCPIAL